MPRSVLLGLGISLTGAVGYGSPGSGQCLAPRAPGALAALHEACVDRLPDCTNTPRDSDGRCIFPAAEVCVFSCGLCDTLSEIASCRCPAVAGQLLPAMASKVGPVAATLNAVFKRALGMAEGWGLKTEVHSQDPWIIEVHNLIRPQEIARIEELRVEDRRSEHKLHEGDGFRKVVVNDCMSPICSHDPVIVGIYARVADLLGIPSENFESFEMLRYRPGELYKPHYDSQVPSETDEAVEALVSGPRLLTMIFSFRHAQHGGETCFPRLDLCFRPPPGSALIWADVRDGKQRPKQRQHRRRRWKNNFWAVEERTLHEARPVKHGEKFNANFWVHPYQHALLDASFTDFHGAQDGLGYCLAKLYGRRFQ